MGDGNFAKFLELSMDVLATEYPSAYRRVAQILAGRTAALSIDGEDVALAFPRGRFRIVDQLEDPSIRVKSRRETILSVTDGTTTMEDAVWDEDLRIYGDLDDLLCFLEALRAYLHGAVRSPNFPWLLDAYRRDACPSPQNLYQQLLTANRFVRTTDQLENLDGY